MSRKLNIRKITALAASLALAGAATFSTAASAQKWQRDPVCDQRVTDECATEWQELGYAEYQHCVWGQPCLECPPNYGYMCGIYSYPGGGWAAKRTPDTPW
jgi:hypothetical protein